MIVIIVVSRSKARSANAWLYRGCSGMWCLGMLDLKIIVVKPLTHISLRCEAPTPSALRVGQLLCSNPSSSNTTSLNSQLPSPKGGVRKGIASHEIARRSRLRHLKGHPKTPCARVPLLGYPSWEPAVTEHVVLYHILGIVL